MKMMKQGTVLFLIASALTSCAGSEVNRRLDEKLAQQTDVQSRKDLDAKASLLLKGTPGLSAKQKEALASLKTGVQTRLRQINEESLKLRSLLVEDVLSPGDRAAEIQDVKTRLRRLFKERIDAIFGAVDQANDVLGRSNLIREAMDLQMMEDETTN